MVTISVIMGIYNCESTLQEAIDSIINQTFSDWELIMCDDGSKDGTFEVASKIREKYPTKIVLLKNEQNQGLNYTLNRCLSVAKGQYIARMDGDDISDPSRFEREVEELNGNPEIAIISTDMSFFDEKGIWGRTHVTQRPQRTDFLSATPFCHAACMVRKEAYLAVGGYSVSKRLLRVEDYHLWVKMYEKGYRGMNIQYPLYMMRDDRNAQGRRKFRYRINESYVKAYAIKALKLPVWTYIYCLKPIIIGLMPMRVYRFMHRKKQSKEICN